MRFSSRSASSRSASTACTNARTLRVLATSGRSSVTVLGQRLRQVVPLPALPRPASAVPSVSGGARRYRPRTRLRSSSTSQRTRASTPRQSATPRPHLRSPRTSWRVQPRRAARPDGPQCRAGERTIGQLARVLRGCRAKRPSLCDRERRADSGGTTNRIVLPQTEPGAPRAQFGVAQQVIDGCGSRPGEHLAAGCSRDDSRDAARPRPRSGSSTRRAPARPLPSSLQLLLRGALRMDSAR